MSRVKIFDIENDTLLIDEELSFHLRVGDRVTIDTKSGPIEYVIEKILFYISLQLGQSCVKIYVYEY